MKIQQVRLDGKRIAAKSWTVADGGDRVKAFVAYARAGHIDAVLGNEFFVVRQIDGRDGIFRPISASASGSRKNAERTRQQMPRPADSSIRKQFTDVAARNRLSAQAHLGIIV